MILCNFISKKCIGVNLKNLKTGIVELSITSIISCLSYREAPQQVASSLHFIGPQTQKYVDTIVQR